MAPVVQLRCGMPESTRARKASALPESSAAVLGELRHATGNLLHRMRYWTTLLESESLGATGAEALNELRSSLDRLQSLIASTTEALRPSEVRRLPIPTADVVRAIAMRLGADGYDAGTVAGAGLDARVFLDPALLDRALALLVDALPAVDGLGDSTEISIAPRPTASDEGTDDARSTGAAVAIRATRRVHGGYGLTANALEEVELAVARKLLADTGCGLTCTRVNDRICVELSLPLEARF